MKLAKNVSRLFTRRRRTLGALPLTASAIGVGAGLMYLLDPDRGSRRRALVRDKGVHTAHRMGNLLDKGARDLEYRLRGIAHEARSIVRQDHPSDELLVERVRSKLGRAVSHPHAIKVESNDGCVTLSGPVLRAERARLLSCVMGVPGVHRVEDRLDQHAPEERIPALQGGGRRRGQRFELMQERWSPVTQIAMGAVGTGLLAFGAARRGSLGIALGLAGSAILVRDIANRPLARVLGIGAGTRAVDFHKTIHVHAPVEEVYDFFTKVENFPHFMAHVRDVQKIDDDHYHWVAEGPAHIPVSWDAEVTQRVPNQIFAWQSVDGAAIGNAGCVRFDPEGDCTRLDIQMSYNPPAGTVGHLVASLFGADPKHAMDQDLVRFQSLLERGKTTARHHEVRAEELGMRR
ncbi:MAG: SRPBCC family protein [Minicystis sp.]